MRARPEVGGRAVGVIGFCMGGTLALDLAALRPDLAAAVSYYGFPARAIERVGSPIELAERMTVAILGHWGDQDVGVGMDHVDALRRKLADAKRAHVFHVYPGLGHGFLKAFLEDERSPGYAQACLSWRRTLDFFRQKLAA